MTAGIESTEEARKQAAALSAERRRQERRIGYDPNKPIILPAARDPLFRPVADRTRSILNEEKMEELDKLERQIEAERALEAAQREEPQLPAVIEVQQKLEKIQAENDRLYRMMSQAMTARNKAREFMTIWSDPRRLPDLIQEVYISHPDVQKVKKDINDEAARRASRQIAHLAVTYELNPFITGMIYTWADGGTAIVEVGYRGYEELIKRDVKFDLDGPREMTPEEKALHGVGPEDRGGMCFVMDWDKEQRFKSAGRPAPTPIHGVGVWKAKNQYGKTDRFPTSKSPQWVAEKNALKDAVRHAVTFAITKTADIPEADMTYDQEIGVWKIAVPTAEWVKDTSAILRFQNLLEEHDVKDQEFNDFLGHNWRYTPLEAKELKERFDDFRGRRDAFEGSFTIESAPESEAPKVEAIAPEKPTADEHRTPQDPQNAPEPSADLIEPEKPLETPFTASSSEPPKQSVTPGEIRDVVTAFAQQHAMTVAVGWQKAGEITGLRSLTTQWAGTADDLRRKLAEWKPEGQLL